MYDAGSLFQPARRAKARSQRGFAVRFILAGMLLLSTGVAAQQEVAGARDFPLIKRYEGSRLIGHDSRAFDSFKLILGKLTTRGGYAVHDAVREVEGRHTRLLYLAPPQRSSLEVFRNYEADLVAKGFSILFKCSGADECESSYGTEFYRVLYPPGKRLQNSELSKAAFNVPAEPHYLAATLARPEGEVAVSLYVAVERGGFEESNNRVAVLLDVIEAKPMEEKMVTVDATKMAKDIAATGKVALYGLYFDTDKADLKRESDPALAEIAKLLKAQPDLKVYIVGHTDNVGGFDYNMGLSQRRARSVVDRLIQTYGIAPDRLKPAGAGRIAPVASNDDEAGRSKNRRVEIVKE